MICITTIMGEIAINDKGKKSGKSQEKVRSISVFRNVDCTRLRPDYHPKNYWNRALADFR
jgi:hypothetical protein